MPAINVQRSSAPTEEGKAVPDTEAEDSLAIPGMRTPARGASGASGANSTLETVQEISQPNTPGPGLDGMIEWANRNGAKPLQEQEKTLDNADIRTVKANDSTKRSSANESGSESGGKGEMKLRTTSVPTIRPNAPASKSAAAGVGRGKPPGEGSTRNMTVETETVVSIPQIPVNDGRVGGHNGSIRTKPSTETIRPKKEKKKTARKAPSVTSGTGEPSHLSKRRPLHHHHFTREDVSDINLHSPIERVTWQGPYSPSFTNGTFSGATSPDRLSSRRPSLNLHIVSTMLTRSRPASSKADIFEAKVASAVDEANSSDSEETFVYESNPPDTGPRRFHSRTPSATSMASQADQRNGVRSVMDGNHSVAMKKSMKFANSYSSNGPEMANGDDDGKGTARSAMGTGRGTTHHHHIGGRWNRNGGNGHPSLFDNESPFPNAAKSKLATAPRHSSGPTSPRVANMTQKGPGKRSSPISAGYDLDDAADDERNERTPLISSVRSNRSSRNRRSGNSMRQLEHQASRRERGILSRFAGCLVLFLMTVLVITGAIGFVFTTTQPLTFDKTVALKNVLASEQDIIFDMKVQARNPNLVQVIIDSTDLVVFAKSKYAGTDTEYWKRPQTTSFLRRALRILDDEYFDPPASPLDPTSPNLEIGHVLAFDSPLIFEGSPFNHDPTSSMGQIRVKHPGNSTLPSGSERWGRILEHEFDLIVRGTLRYTLPFGGRVRSVSIEGRVAVEPNAADGGDAKIWNEAEA